MAEETSMLLSSEEICELPFMLNLPPGTYDVNVGGSVHRLEVLQEQLAVHIKEGGFAVGDRDGLRAKFGPALDEVHGQELRTVIRRRKTKQISENELPAVGEDELLEHLKGEILAESSKYSGQPEQLSEEAARRRPLMTPEEVSEARLHLGKLKAAKALCPLGEILVPLNALIRLYMERFNDFFVEEVTLHQLASQAPLQGVAVSFGCDGALLDRSSLIGKGPPMMRKPWFEHPRPAVEEFTSDLASGVIPDSVTLLEVRARGLLERGATRSAIIEAAAGLELSVTRKLRLGYTKKGKPTTEIDDILKKHIHFNERANKLMYEATGQRVCDLDGKLFQKALGHREKYRHGIAHSDVEPTQQEAEKVIDDFNALRKVVDGIPV